jgi:hypothetical protein
MTSSAFVLLAAAPLVLLFVALRGRGDAVGWWLGLGHGMLALLALVGVALAGDRGFALFTAVVSVYAGAMCAAEVVHLMRRRPRSA